MVRAIVEARREDDRDVTGSATSLGLDKPVATVTLTDANGTERTLKVGRTLPGATTQQAAVESSDRAGKPVIVAKRDIADIFKPLSALRARALVAAGGMAPRIWGLPTPAIPRLKISPVLPVMWDRSCARSWRSGSSRLVKRRATETTLSPTLSRMRLSMAWIPPRGVCSVSRWSAPKR